MSIDKTPMSTHRPSAVTPARPIYLDNHATTRVDPRVVAAMLPFFDQAFGNAASVNHAYGWEAAHAVNDARGQIAELLHCPPDAVIFTSGGTEANNLALKGALRAASRAGHLVVSAVEHRSVLDPARRLQRQGFDLTILEVDGNGRTDPAAVELALRPNTVLVSVMLANNEVGTLNPVAEIGAICRARGVLLHCDAVQAAGRIPVDVSQLSADLVTISAHKLYGPKGVAALYVRRDGPPVRLEPILDGGGHERRLRSGTLPVPLIVGFGTACELARDALPVETTRLNALRNRLWSGLGAELTGLVLNGHPTERLPGNLHVSFDGVDGEALMNGLTEVAVSSGSACTSADPEPSHVLRAMGVSELRSKASVRFGLGRFTTESEIDAAIRHVCDIVSRLRAGRR
jgi:cysteine desulfurase